MLGLSYTAALAVAWIGMLLIDRRFLLAFWYDRRRTWLTLAISGALFVIWDILGIVLRIFRHGGSPYDTGILIAPEFPIEELLFLAFFMYCTLVVVRLTEVIWPPTSS